MPLGWKGRKHPPYCYLRQDERRMQTHTHREALHLQPDQPRNHDRAHMAPQLIALTLLRVVLEALLLMFRLFHRWLLALSQ